MIENFVLNNGVEIPALGLGTWFIEDKIAAQAVREAVNIGYRHFDTAQAYGNERGVGEGIRSCGVRRSELFVTTKLAAEIKDYKQAIQAIDNSLQVAGLDYFDCMLIHAPQPWANFREGRYVEGNQEAWRAVGIRLSGGKTPRDRRLQFRKGRSQSSLRLQRFAHGESGAGSCRKYAV